MPGRDDAADPHAPDPRRARRADPRRRPAAPGARHGRGARVLPGRRGRTRRAATGPASSSPDRALALGESPVRPLQRAHGADAPRAGRQRRRRPHRAQAPGRGSGESLRGERPLPLVLARAPRRALAVPGPGGRAPGRRRPRRLLRMSAPRLLVIMGSGETAPTMVTPHREIVARFGSNPSGAVLLDTPYGFQENASE